MGRFITVVYWDNEGVDNVFHIVNGTKENIRRSFIEHGLRDVKSIKCIEIENEGTLFQGDDIEEFLKESKII